MRQIYHMKKTERRGRTTYIILSAATAIFLLLGTTISVMAQTNFEGSLNSVSITDAAGTNSAPTAIFTYTQDGDTYTFDASNSADPDGTITSFSWNFGDGTTDEGETVQHTINSYPAPVTLTVASADGGIAITQTLITVQSFELVIDDNDTAFTATGNFKASDDFEEASINTSNWGMTTPNFMVIKNSSDLVGPNYLAAAWWKGAGTFTTDQYSEIEVTTASLNSGPYYIGVTCRNDENTNGAANSYYGAYLQGNPRKTFLVKRTDGVGAHLVTAENTTWNDGDILRIECVGTNPTLITVKKNGAAVSATYTNVSDSTDDFETGGPGVIGGGAAESVAAAEAWEGGNL